MIFMSDYSELEKDLRCKFRKALRDYKTGNVVDILMDIIKEDYILLAKVPLSCRDCFSYNRSNGWPSDWCVLHQEYIRDCSRAYNCKDFISGEEAARRAFARVHNELNGDLIIK